MQEINMIKDNIRNAKLYENAHPSFKKAFKIILDTPYDAENGTEEFENVKRIVQTYETFKPEEKRMEAHEKYIDIQYVASGREKFFFADKSFLKISKPYDAQKDVEFYDTADLEKSPKAESATLEAGEFAIFFPDDAHKPSLNAGVRCKVKKILLKIPVL